MALAGLEAPLTAEDVGCRAGSTMRKAIPLPLFDCIKIRKFNTYIPLHPGVVPMYLFAYIFS